MRVLYVTEKSTHEEVVRKEVPAGETRKTTQYEYVIEYGERVE